MFINTENVIESHRNIQINNLYYKTHPKHGNTFFENSIFSKTHLLLNKLDIHSSQRFPRILVAGLETVFKQYVRSFFVCFHAAVYVYIYIYCFFHMYTYIHIDIHIFVL